MFCSRSAIGVASVFLGAHLLLAQDFNSQLLAAGSTSGWSVTSADFDGDGDVDAAVTRTNSASVSWIENRGMQPSVSRQIYQSQARAYGIAAGDFDGDGDADIAVADYDEDRFLLLRNSASGDTIIFTDVSIRDNCNGAFAVIAVDLNGDQYMDLATCESNGNTFRVLESGENGFTQIFAGNIPGPINLCKSDFDDDGDLDFFVASNSTSNDGAAGGVYKVTQLSPAQFSIQHILSNLYLTSVDAADVDHDNDIDIVASQFSTGEVFLFRYNGATYAQTSLIGDMPNARSVVFADFNVDGWVDMIASAEGGDNGEGNLRWWRNVNGTSFVGANLSGMDRPRGITLTDYDLDSDIDALVVDGYNGDVYFYRNLLGTPSYIVGTLTAASDGAPIADALLTVHETGSFDFTDANGQYQIETGPGLATLDVTHPCWNDTSLTGIETTIGEYDTVNISLTRPNLLLANSSLNLLVQNHIVTTTELEIENVGNGLMTVTASASGIIPEEQWLSVFPTYIELLPGETYSFTVTVDIDTTNNAVWDFLGDLELLTNSCPDTAVHVAVYIQVLDADDNNSSLPLTTELHPAYPNPFNSTTTISYALSRSGNVNLTIFDLAGRSVATLVNESQSAGAYRVPFQASGFASGVFWISLQSSDASMTQKILYIK